MSPFLTIKTIYSLCNFSSCPNLRQINKLSLPLLLILLLMYLLSYVPTLLLLKVIWKPTSLFSSNSERVIFPISTLYTKSKWAILKFMGEQQSQIGHIKAVCSWDEFRKWDWVGSDILQDKNWCCFKIYFHFRYSKYKYSYSWGIHKLREIEIGLPDTILKLA